MGTELHSGKTKTFWRQMVVTAAQQRKCTGRQQIGHLRGLKAVTFMLRVFSDEKKSGKIKTRPSVLQPHHVKPRIASVLQDEQTLLIKFNLINERPCYPGCKYIDKDAEGRKDFSEIKIGRASCRERV